MFTGIVEELGKVVGVEKEDTNLHIRVKSTMTKDLQIDQSVAHNGVCLTVVAIEGDEYVVTAIEETLQKTNTGLLAVGDEVNLERAMVSGARLDGHMVQGHVDGVAKCVSIEEKDGSWHFTFEYAFDTDQILVDKGSVCVNGVSLTVVSPTTNTFKVAIIPFTYEHTTFKHFEVGSEVNIEFDIIGKYLSKYAGAYLEAMVAKK